jgi:hypothetical protein
VSGWPGVLTAANGLSIVYALWAVSRDDVDLPGDGRLTLALAVALNWLAVLRWFLYNGHLYVVVRTLHHSLPSMGGFMLSAAPIFMAYGVFAAVVWGNNEARFDGITLASIAQFAVLNGDVVRETFQMTLAASTTAFLQFLSQAFLYFFVCTFIYVVLKAAVAIMEESFQHSRPDAEPTTTSSQVFGLAPARPAADAEGQHSSPGSPAAGAAASPPTHPSAGAAEAKVAAIEAHKPRPHSAAYRLPHRLRTVLQALDAARDEAAHFLAHGAAARFG